MYNELIDMLKLKGIEFEKGLSEQEITKITKEYRIEFPQELKDFYMTALPVSKGFYNWRNFDSENIQYIKKAMDIPINDIYEMADEVYWCDEWGEEPSKSDQIKMVRGLLKGAPILIPIYSHRYFPAINLEHIPVLSIYGTDLIYYGENLFSYFEIEFGEKKQSNINYSEITYVPFWSDLL